MNVEKKRREEKMDALKEGEAMKFTKPRREE